MMISVCIPAYNRASVLPDLLDSILSQKFSDYEVLICEDSSPQRLEIRAVVECYKQSHPDRIRYVENEKNLGYDGNLRQLVDMSAGRYCLFMGNDDLMCAGALSAVSDAIERHPNVGVVVRSYAAFDGKPENIVQVFRYFPDERFFPAGPDTVGTAYRRSVVIPGMVINRDAARRYSTAEFDGTLLYQLYLVANILLEMNAVFVPKIVALYRKGGIPDFGNAEVEKNKFVPTNQTPGSSVEFMRGMLHIAAAIESRRGVGIYRRIVADIANYSYPILSIQRGKPALVFVKYWWSLAKLGFGRYPVFHVYFLALLVLGARRVDRLICFIKSRLGYTPALGSIFKGRRP